MTTRTATAKRPDDKPFDFNLDAVQAEVDLTPFRFNFQGRRFTMTHLQDLNIWDVVGLADGGDLVAMTKGFEAALGDDFAEFRKLKLANYQLEALFNAYREYCGVTAGESQASSGS